MEVVIPTLVSSLAAPNTWWVQLGMRLSLHKDDISTYDYKYSSRNLYTKIIANDEILSESTVVLSMQRWHSKKWQPIHISYK